MHALGLTSPSVTSHSAHVLVRCFLRPPPPPHLPQPAHAAPPALATLAFKLGLKQPRQAKKADGSLLPPVDFYTLDPPDGGERGNMIQPFYVDSSGVVAQLRDWLRLVRSYYEPIPFFRQSATGTPPLFLNGYVKVQ